MIVVKTVDGGAANLNQTTASTLKPDQVPQYLVIDKNAPISDQLSPKFGRNIDSVIQEEEKEIEEQKEPQKIKISVEN